MEKTEVIHIAIENLINTAGVDAIWTEKSVGGLDGMLTVMIVNEKIEFNTEIKKELRNHQLIQLEKYAKEYPPFLIVAERIFPKIKEQLRLLNIAYLETNGNVFFHENKFRYFIEANKPLQTPIDKQNRAFTKTGIKVLFHFLLNPELVNLPQREIARKTGVAHGNIAYILNGLKENGFLAHLNKNTFQLINKKDLLERWMIAYKENYQPTIELGKFRFADNDNFIHWRNVKLQRGKTWWGGEPAGDVYTNWLRPGELTLYTTETRNDLIRNYRLIPDPKGDVVVYRKFWNTDQDNESDVVPPFLAYIDLVNTGEKRCLETAEMIYKKYVEPNL